MIHALTRPSFLASPLDFPVAHNIWCLLPFLHAQAQGFPDGPKEPAHYYTIIQPYDDYGQPSMPEFYPDAALGVPEDGFFAFDTTADHPYPAFKSLGGAALSAAELDSLKTLVAELK